MIYKIGNYQTWKISIDALGLTDSFAKVNNGDNQDGYISILPQLFKQ